MSSRPVFSRPAQKISEEVKNDQNELVNRILQDIKNEQDEKQQEEVSKNIWKVACFRCGYEFVRKGTSEYNNVLSEFKRMMPLVKNNRSEYKKIMTKFNQDKDYSDRCKTSRWVAMGCPRDIDKIKNVPPPEEKEELLPECKPKLIFEQPPNANVHPSNA
jgi:hypothetical protein